MVARNEVKVEGTPFLYASSLQLDRYKTKAVAYEFHVGFGRLSQEKKKEELVKMSHREVLL
jgi:hypothetical protein